MNVMYPEPEHGTSSVVGIGCFRPSCVNVAIPPVLVASPGRILRQAAPARNSRWGDPTGRPIAMCVELERGQYFIAARKETPLGVPTPVMSS
jgi:hypothetical protein